MTNMIKRKRLLNILMATALAPLLPIYVFSGVIQRIFIGLSAIMLVAFLAAYIVLWRCPYCGSQLGRIDDSGKYCKHCGKKIF